MKNQIKEKERIIQIVPDNRWIGGYYFLMNTGRIFNGRLNGWDPNESCIYNEILLKIPEEKSNDQ